MNDLDNLLEHELARMLNPIVRIPAPRRRGRPKSHRHLRIWVGSEGPGAPRGNADEAIDLSRSVSLLADPVSVVTAVRM